MSKFFKDELEAFRREEEGAQQFFLGYYSLQRIPGHNPWILSELNENPMFWITTRFALLVAAFVALGRIFDQDQRSVHNIDHLLSALSRHRHALSRGALMARRIAEGLDPDFAERYVSDKHDLTVEEIRALRKRVASWRAIYNTRYRDIRNMVFAHRGVPFSQTDDLLAKALIPEFLEMLGFLDSVHQGLYELYTNGRQPDFTPKAFDVEPSIAQQGDTAGERMYRQAMKLMFEMLPAPPR